MKTQKIYTICYKTNVLMECYTPDEAFIQHNYYLKEYGPGVEIKTPYNASYTKLEEKE